MTLIAQKYYGAVTPIFVVGALLYLKEALLPTWQGRAPIGTRIIGPPGLTSEILPFVSKGKKRTKFHRIPACALTEILWNSGALLVL